MQTQMGPYLVTTLGTAKGHGQGRNALLSLSESLAVVLQQGTMG